MLTSPYPEIDNMYDVASLCSGVVLAVVGSDCALRKDKLSPQWWTAAAIVVGIMGHLSMLTLYDVKLAFI